MNWTNQYGSTTAPKFHPIGTLRQNSQKIRWVDLLNRNNKEKSLRNCRHPARNREVKENKRESIWELQEHKLDIDVSILELFPINCLIIIFICPSLYNLISWYFHQIKCLRFSLKKCLNIRKVSLLFKAHS